MTDRRPGSTTASGGNVKGAGPSADEIVAFLKSNPNFLIDHAELLAHLTPPTLQQGKNIVDFQGFMLERLREEVIKLKTQHRALISTIRLNLISQQRIHAACLAVIGARNFEQLLQIVTTDLSILLDVDVTTLCIESGTELHPPMAGIYLLEPGSVDHLLGFGKDALLEDRVQGDSVIFGSGADLVKSEALLRLSIPGAPLGLLAIGSRRPTKFKPGQGTELLSFLARTLAVTISQWLDL